MLRAGEGGENAVDSLLVVARGLVGSLTHNLDSVHLPRAPERPPAAADGDAGPPVAARADDPLRSIVAFLKDCCEVTGRPEDRLSSAPLWHAYRAWNLRGNGDVLTRCGFGRRFAAYVRSGQVAAQGAKIGAIKASRTIYVGVSLKLDARSPSPLEGQRQGRQG